MAPLPAFVAFPGKEVRATMAGELWESHLAAWTALSRAYLARSDADFAKITSSDDSVAIFVVSFAREVAVDADVVRKSAAGLGLVDAASLLTARLLKAPPTQLLQWESLSDISKVYGKKIVAPLLSSLFQMHSSRKILEGNLATLKKFLILNLDAGIKGEIKALEEKLVRVNHLINASPDVAAFFLAGTDFLDGLIACYKIMNPPLRQAIITTTYLCLIGLTEGASPNYSMLVDQLFSLKTAAEAHKSGPLNANDSLVAELVTVTPILKQIQQRAEETAHATNALKSRTTALEGFRKPEGGSIRPTRRFKRKLDKGKGIAVDDDEAEAQMQLHRMEQITQIQDLFPELGSGFVSKLLDAYDEDPEQVIAHLVEGSLPPHLANANRTEQLNAGQWPKKSLNMGPPTAPPQIAQRLNVFDGDELDRLDVDMSKLHFGKHNPNRTADDILRDRTAAPDKSTILSALAAFDSDEDERDDTYDAEDVGGTVDSAPNQEADASQDANEEALFRAFQATPTVFERDGATRRGTARAKLREETGMTDEAIEGWALMLSRNPQQKRRLEAKYTAFTGAQVELPSTAWRANGESDADGGSSSTRGDRGGFRGRGRGRGAGNVAGPTGDKETEQARRRKEANKSSRANHNRRAGRAQKMARAGFPA